jgi:ABC-type bacteriocin/lantibiotic exporter with double-glycine peptidase domain
MKLYFDFLKRYLCQYKLELFYISTITILQSIIVTCIPLSTSAIVDKGITQNDRIALRVAAIVMALLFLSNALITILNNYLMAKVGEKIGYTLREELNTKICKLKYGFFLKNTASNIVNSFNKEIDTIKTNISYMLLRVMGNIISLSASITMIFLINWKIGLFILSTSALYVISIKEWGKVISPLAEKSFYYNERIINVLLNTYKNAVVVKMNSALSYISKHFKSEYTSFYSNEIKLETAYTANINMGMLIMSITTVVLWCFGGIKCMENSLSIGSLIAIIGYQNMLTNPINFICDFSNSYQTTNKAIKNFESILACEEETSGNLLISPGIRNIKLKNVSFKYDSVLLLEDINLNLEKDICGIIGESGIGKSTIAKLIVRLLNPDSGEICINDILIDHINLSNLRKEIGYIMQDTLFFNDTILNNVFFDEHKDYNKLEEFSRNLMIYDEIMRFSEQWETVLCEDSQNISGGQKKRIDILRNVLKNASVLIFDETFSGIDIRKKCEIYEFIQRIKKDYIIIIISHDQKDLEICSRLYKIENRKINKIL